MKKQTTLQVLQEIRDLLKKHLNPTNDVSINPDEIVIDIPETTIKEIIEGCNNKTSKGTPLIWSPSWILKSDLYTKEKTRKGRWIFSKKLLEETRNKTWQEQEEILKSKGGERMNLAEVVYCLYFHEKSTGERLLENDWYWTNSRDSDGRIVLVGVFGSGGAYVRRDSPYDSRDSLGVCLSRRVSSKPE